MVGDTNAWAFRAETAGLGPYAALETLRRQGQQAGGNDFATTAQGKERRNRKHLQHLLYASLISSLAPRIDNRINTLRQEIQDLERELADVEQAIVVTQNAIAVKTDQLNDINAQIADTEARLSDNGEEREAIEQEIDHATRNATAADARQENAEQKLEDIAETEQCGAAVDLMRTANGIAAELDLPPDSMVLRTINGYVNYAVTPEGLRITRLSDKQQQQLAALEQNDRSGFHVPTTVDFFRVTEHWAPEQRQRVMALVEESRQAREEGDQAREDKVAHEVQLRTRESEANELGEDLAALRERRSELETEIVSLEENLGDLLRQQEDLTAGIKDRLATIKELEGINPADLSSEDIRILYNEGVLDDNERDLLDLESRQNSLADVVTEIANVESAFEELMSRISAIKNTKLGAQIFSLFAGDSSQADPQPDETSELTGDSAVQHMEMGGGIFSGFNIRSFFRDVANPSPAEDDVRAVQRELQRQGLYEGEIDGSWGPETSESFSQFLVNVQQDESYIGKVDGLYGPLTRASLAIQGVDEEFQTAVNNLHDNGKLRSLYEGPYDLETNIQMSAAYVPPDESQIWKPSSEPVMWA